MKIAGRSQINTELYNKHPELLHEQLRQEVCKELMKHKVFIEPPMSYAKSFTTIEMHFFALSYDDVNRLKSLIDRYPF